MSDGICLLDPIVVNPGDGGSDCDIWWEPSCGTCQQSLGSSEESGFEGCGGGTGPGDTGPGDGGGGGGPGEGDGAGDGGEPLLPPAEDDEVEDSRNCPVILGGKVIAALITVAGTSHTFEFTGSMTRLSAAPSPATYSVNPTLSRDGWWMATGGTITVNCNGYYSPRAFGYRVWIGVASYAGHSDVQMVMAPGHPSF